VRLPSALARSLPSWAERFGQDVEEYPRPAIPDFQPATGQSLFDLFEQDAKFVMDRVDGQSLSDVLNCRSSPPMIRATSPAPSACSRSWILASRLVSVGPSWTASS